MKQKKGSPVSKPERERKEKDDRSLVNEALAGDQEAYKVLLNRHQRAIYHVIFQIIHNQDEAWDLVQETFMKAFGSLSTYKTQYRFTTWLYRIAANCSIDYLRKKKIYSFSLDEPMETKEGKVERELADLTYDPESAYVLKQKVTSIEQAISSLPKKYREVITYRHKNDKSYEEIARILRIPVGTVKARIFRARELLKKKLKNLRRE